MSDELRTRITDILHDHYGYVRTDCVDELAVIIATEARPQCSPQPEPKPGAGCTCGFGALGQMVNPLCMVHGRPAPKGDTVAALLTEAHRKLDETLENVNTNDLRNAIVLVIAAVKELAKSRGTE